MEIGDIVSVRLKGRLLNGLVIAKKKDSEIIKTQKFSFGDENIRYLSVEGVLQKKIFQNWWREWLESLASFYKVSKLKMFKTAFPPGWIGKHKMITKDFKYQIWIELQREGDFLKQELTHRELSVINTLKHKGNWQSELINSGYNSTLISSMVGKNLLIKTKRKKIIKTKLNSSNNDFVSIGKPDLTSEQKKSI